MSAENSLFGPDADPAQQRALSKALLVWFDRAKRDMPWRRTRDPYAIWLSETMLQQTQVETVKPYYDKFLRAFPTVADLAAADLAEVLKLWAGLGYYRRARHLHAAARVIVERHGGKIPPTAAQLQELPGVGRYTAGAVASIAFGEAVPVLDGNVMRVLARVGDVHADISRPQTQKRLWVMAESLLPPPAPAGRPGAHNEALMELGATVCLPRNPTCLLCPLRQLCQAFARGTQDRLPVKTRKAATPVVHLAAIVLFRPGPHGREILVAQRPRGGLWEQMWEAPTLTLRKGRAPRTDESAAALAALVRNHLGLSVASLAFAGEVTHQLTHRRIEYQVYTGELPGKRAVPEMHGLSCDYAASRWIDIDHLLAGGAVPLSQAARRVVERAITSAATP